MNLRSPAFGNRHPIPATYTCTGKDLSPPMVWNDVPGGVAAFALLCDDPDSPSGLWNHWVIYNIPGQAVGLPEGIPKAATLSGGALQGRNGWGTVGYRGPCPPRGTHRYVFRLMGLAAAIPLGPGATRDEVIVASRGLLLDQAEYVGTFSRG